MQKNIPTATAVISATPPMTPPTIGPIGVDFLGTGDGVGVGVGVGVVGTGTGVEDDGGLVVGMWVGTDRGMTEDIAVDTAPPGVVKSRPI